MVRSGGCILENNKSKVNIEKYPNGFDRYVFNKLIEYLKQLLRFNEMSKLNEEW